MAFAGTKNPRVLYFTAGMVPTEAEVAEIQSCGNNVAVRNSGRIPKKLDPGSIEKADFVAGNVPQTYAHIPALPGLSRVEFKPEPEPAKAPAWKPNA